MAIIYQHTNEKALVLEPREAYQRKLDLGNWTEIRIGMFWGSAGYSTPTSSQVTTETVVQVTRTDILTFGLKDSATNILPGYSGSYFIGLSMTGSVNTEVVSPFGTDGRYQANIGSGYFYGAGFYGTNSYVGAQNLSYMDYTPATGTNYCGLYVLKLVLNNSGSSTQTVSAYASMTKTVTAASVDNYSSYYLSTQMQNASFGTVSTITWNDGVTAFPIPDSLWIRTPYFYNRPRISNISVIKYS